MTKKTNIFNAFIRFISLLESGHFILVKCDCIFSFSSQLRFEEVCIFHLISYTVHASAKRPWVLFNSNGHTLLYLTTSPEG